MLNAKGYDEFKSGNGSIGFGQCAYQLEYQLKMLVDVDSEVDKDQRDPMADDQRCEFCLIPNSLQKLIFCIYYVDD